MRPPDDRPARPAGPARPVGPARPAGPAVAIGASALAAAVVPHVGHAYAAVAAVTVVVGLAAAAVDARERRIPNRLVMAGVMTLGPSLLLAGLVDHRLGAVWWGALAGVGGAAGPLLALHLASPAGLGLGDVKLAVVLGAGLGAGHPVLGPLAVLAAVVVALLWRVVRHDLHAARPFGPPLALGAAITLAGAPAAVRALGLGWFG